MRSHQDVVTQSFQMRRWRYSAAHLTSAAQASIKHRLLSRKHGLSPMPGAQSISDGCRLIRASRETKSQQICQSRCQIMTLPIGHAANYSQIWSFAHLKCRAAEKKSKETSDWSKDSIAASWGYLERKTPNFRPKVHRVRKELASHYYQLMMGHVVIAPYLKHKIKTSDSDTC
jgi:hypothetical protein